MPELKLIDWFPHRDLGSPPFTFQGVSARVFPIPTSYSRLELLCQRLFNIAPGIAIFRPALPIVNFVVINYGRMETKALSYGWVAQNEVAFTIPMECYLYDKGRYVFYDYTVSAPFIYVDSDSSLHTGREIYGWPKIKFCTAPLTEAWHTSPQIPQTVWAAETRVFQRDPFDPRYVSRRFLECRRDTSWLDANSVSGNGLNIRRTFWGMSGRAARFGFDSIYDSVLNPAHYHGTTAGLDFGSKSEALMRFLINRGDFLAVNLRQTRDSEDIQRCAYQAISWAKMRTTRLNDGGFLGASRILTGDASGGHRVHISHFDSQPIVSALGLVPTGTTESEGTPVSIFEPWMPYWVDLDLEYGAPYDVISYVRGDTKWRTSLPYQPQASSKASEGPRAPVPKEQTIDQQELPIYRQPRGGAAGVLVGPYNFPECTAFVFPLRSDRRKLEEFCRNLEGRLFKNQGGFAFSLRPRTTPDLDPESAWVYMVLTNYDEMSAPNNQVGWWASRELSFYFAADLLIDGKFIMSVSLAPFVFMDSGLSLISTREFSGWPSQRAYFKEVGDGFSQPGIHPTSRELLHVQTEVAPNLFLGDQVDVRPLLRIIRPNVTATPWADQKPESYQQQLRQSGPYRILGFKQTRDSQHLDQAVYQEVTLTSIHVTKIFEGPIPIDHYNYIVLNRYPTHPIFSQLGIRLQGRSCRQEISPFLGPSETDFEVASAIAPFWIRFERHEHKPINLLWRSTAQSWQPGQNLKDFLRQNPNLSLRQAIRRLVPGNEEDHHEM